MKTKNLVTIFFIVFVCFSTNAQTLFEDGLLHEIRINQKELDMSSFNINSYTLLFE